MSCEAETPPGAPRQPRVRVAAILLRDQEILLVRHEKDGRTYWLLPGGGLDWGESLAEAAVREVREETGLDIACERLVLACDSIDPAGNRHGVHLCFTARITGGTLRAGTDGRLVDAAWRPVSELGTLPFHPPIGAAVQALLEGGTASAAGYLGRVWTP